MSAEVETMMYVGETPWHGLGTYVGDEPVKSDEAIVASGLDWEVEEAPLTAKADDDTRIIVPTHKALVRETDKRLLGVVGQSYGVVQNREAFAFLDGLVADGSMRYHTAGSLKDGKHVWLLAQFDTSEIVPGDRVDKFLLLYNTHDGSKAIRALETQVRVVCANTAQMALQEGHGRGLKIRHTVHVLNKLEEAQKVLVEARERAKGFDEFAKRLASFQFTQKEWDEYSHHLFPAVDIDAGETKLKKTLRDNKRAKLTELFEQGRGQDIAGVGGTAWAAYNATVEFANYHRGVVKKNAVERRFESSLFGSGSQFIDDGVVKLDEMLQTAA